MSKQYLGLPDPETSKDKMSAKIKRNLKLFVGAAVLTAMIVAAYKKGHSLLRFFGLSSEKDKLSKKELNAIVFDLANAKKSMISP